MPARVASVARSTPSPRPTRPTRPTLAPLAPVVSFPAQPGGANVAPTLTRASSWATASAAGTVLPDAWSAWLASISQFPLCSVAEERALVARVHAAPALAQARQSVASLGATIRLYRALPPDARAACDELWARNQRLLVAPCVRYEGVCVRAQMSLTRDDLKSAAQIGLLRAILKFQPARGLKLSTYAMWWIKQAITREMLDTGHHIRVPVYISGRLAQLRRAETTLATELGRDPSDAELAGALGLDLAQLAELRAVQGQLVRSLEAPLDGSTDSGGDWQGDGGPRTLGSTLADTGEGDAQTGEVTSSATIAARETALASRELLRQLRVHAEQMSLLGAGAGKGALTPRHWEVLALRYGLDDGEEQSLAEVGRRFGFSRERARQLEEEALARLRAAAVSLARARTGERTKRARVALLQEVVA